jgi:hypothetical protein
MPNIVKGSRQEQMIVVPYRPWRQGIFTVWVVLAVALAGGFGVFIGHNDATRGQTAIIIENQRMREELLIYRDEVSDLRSSFAILDRGSLVDQRATDEAQATIATLRSKVSQLEQDINFYRQVMAPENEDVGLVITQAEIMPCDSSNRYKYKLVFRQQGQQDAMLEGRAMVNIIGNHMGDQQTWPLEQLSELDGSEGFRLNFRYFQNVEGELLLPEYFRPEKIEINASSTRPVEKAVSKTFSWSVSGALNVCITQ